MPTKVWGIDVSKYNHPIDWKKVKDAGVKFAILRWKHKKGIKSYSNRRTRTRQKDLRLYASTWDV